MAALVGLVEDAAARPRHQPHPGAGRTRPESMLSAVAKSHRKEGALGGVAATIAGRDESKRSQRKLRRSAGEGRIQRKRFLCKKTLRRPTKRKKFPLRGPSYRDPFMNVRPCQVLLRDAPR